MAGVAAREKLFRVDAAGRTLGRFFAVERVRDDIVLLEWEWERNVPERSPGPRAGTIVLTDPDGKELRRWDFGRFDCRENRAVVGSIRQTEAASSVASALQDGK